MEHQKASSAKWNTIDIKPQADKFDEKSITCEQIDFLVQMELQSSESNLLPSVVRFDWIDAAMIMITN